eukprot:g323.t1
MSMPRTAGPVARVYFKSAATSNVRIAERVRKDAFFQIRRAHFAKSEDSFHTRMQVNAILRCKERVVLCAQQVSIRMSQDQHRDSPRATFAPVARNTLIDVAVALIQAQKALCLSCPAFTNSSASPKEAKSVKECVCNGDRYLRGAVCEICASGEQYRGEACERCPVGYYKDAPGIHKGCTACPRGRWSDKRGNKALAECHACANTQDTTGEAHTAVEDCVCKPGYFGKGCASCAHFEDLGESGRSAWCPGGGVLVIQPGFWSVNNDSDIMKCPFAEACLEGSRCAAGYDKNLCASCAVRHSRSGARCVQCPQSDVINGLVVLLGFLVISTVLFFLVRQTLQAGHDNSAYKSLAKRLREALGAPEAEVYVVDGEHLRPMVVEGAARIEMDGAIRKSLLIEDVESATDHLRRSTHFMGAANVLAIPVRSDDEQRPVALVVVTSPASFSPSAPKKLASIVHRSADKVRLHGMDILSMAFKVFFSYMQFTAMASSLRIQWPSEIVGMFDVQMSVSSAGEQILSLDCAIRGSCGSAAEQGCSAEHLFYAKFVAMMILPVILTMCAAAVWGTQYVYRVRHSPGHWLEKGESWSSAKLAKLRERKMGNFLVSVIVTLFYVHSNLTRTTFTLFTCRDIGGAQYLDTEPSAPCWRGQHVSWAIAGGLFGFLYVLGIPSASTILLYRNRRMLSDFAVRARLGFLYNGYRRGTYWWETVVMLRKALLASVAVFLRNADAQLQVAFTLLVVCISGALHLSWRPYDFALLDRLESWSLLTCFVTFFLGIVLMAPGALANSWWISLVVIGVNVSYVLYFTIKSFRQKSCDCSDACECSVDESGEESSGVESDSGADSGADSDACDEESDAESSGAESDSSDEESESESDADEESDVSDEETSESDSSGEESDADSEIWSPAPSASSMLNLLRSARDWMLATDGDRVAVQNGRLNFSQLRGRRQRAMPKAAEDIDFAVLDPGRVSWLSILHARLCVKDQEIEMLGWTTVPGKVYHEAMSSYVELQKYDEERRKKKEEYQRAIDICKGTRKNTCVLEHYEAYCHASAVAAPAFMHEQARRFRQTLEFRLRVESRKYAVRARTKSTPSSLVKAT